MFLCKNGGISMHCVVCRNSKYIKYVPTISIPYSSKQFLRKLFLFFFNLEIVVNSNRCCKFQVFLLNKLIFCCVNYSMAETIQGEKLFSEIWYIFVPIILQILSDQIYCQNFAKLAFSCIFRSTGIRSRSGLFSNSELTVVLNTILVF